MTVDDLKETCRKILANGHPYSHRVTLVGDGPKQPFRGLGFPRPELLCVNADKQYVWSFPAAKLLKAIEKIQRAEAKNG